MPEKMLHLTKSDLPITINTEILGGTPVFHGTHVPVKALFEYLRRDYSLDEFLGCFPSVTRDAALAVLGEAEYAALAVAGA